jgi:hypothetical protein
MSYSRYDISTLRNFTRTIVVASQQQKSAVLYLEYLASHHDPQAMHHGFLSQVKRAVPALGIANHYV